MAAGEELRQLLHQHITTHVEVPTAEKKQDPTAQHYYYCDSKDPAQVWRGLAEKVSMLRDVWQLRQPVRTLMATYVGSRRYNLHTPQSDLDYLVFSPKCILVFSRFWAWICMFHGLVRHHFHRC